MWTATFRLQKCPLEQYSDALDSSRKLYKIAAKI